MSWYTPYTYVAGDPLTAAQVRNPLTNDVSHEYSTAGWQVQTVQLVSTTLSTMDVYTEVANGNAPTSCPFTKHEPDTYMRIQGNWTYYASTATTYVQAGVSVSQGANQGSAGPGYVIYVPGVGRLIGGTSSHRATGFIIKTPQLPAGKYTAYPMLIIVSTQSGAGASAVWDTGDYCSMVINEVNA